ncbi:TaqI-like C-terminal specificity domain-containing protein [Fibrobacter sp. UWH9]|uniref:Eco57I restriction-modification methylase domain-containing protein n=1 Tax=Fibrobacter sp. UWH9 TaxID=1896213 RepID=UPI0009123849|nr:N-6 DNA methylase [Fibrobacter sp. UWH9]SHH93307.1 TaqI-like C-terminal specificity domain-containing protein [Fibrobacter sp. UWH9]
MRYQQLSSKKANGIVYTPTALANFLANQLICFSKIDLKNVKALSILDPAVGGGELLISLINTIYTINKNILISAVGYETDSDVAKETNSKLSALFPDASVKIHNRDFLSSFESISNKFDFIIANPPYVRTQILGAEKSSQISQKLNLNGRVDIYYAFIIAVKRLLHKDGIAGYITSNKFLTIKAGACVRDFILENYNLHNIVDFGDSKLFSAAVLPCTMTFSLGSTTTQDVAFTSIYETKKLDSNVPRCQSIFDHISDNGCFMVEDGKVFDIKQGALDNSQKDHPWTISFKEKEKWMLNVKRNTWKHISDIGKVRVGIKTTADNVFIGNDWNGSKSDIELLKPLITHRDAGQITASANAGWKVLYTHEIVNSKKTAVNLDLYPKSKQYLKSHYSQLSSRSYIKKAHRNWYEIWVPQNPSAWSKRKIVFRDISEKPTFWLDTSGAIVNGDCYWIEINDSIIDDTIYLALAVVNSNFIEKYYDACFNTKLYSGKRRFMSQYVEQFPIPDPNSKYAKKAVQIVRNILSSDNCQNKSFYMEELNTIVDAMFNVA